MPRQDSLTDQMADVMKAAVEMSTTYSTGQTPVTDDVVSHYVDHDRGRVQSYSMDDQGRTVVNVFWYDEQGTNEHFADELSLCERVLRTDQLREGMVVNCHGLLCLIDQPIKTYRENEVNGPTYYTPGRVLNRDEVSTDSVPLSYTAPDYRNSHRVVDDNHRWGIQGNRLAHWVVVFDHPEAS